MSEPEPFRVPADVQPDQTQETGWVSSTSGISDAHRVEVSRVGDTVMVRHAGYPDGPVVAFRAAEFRAFLEGAAAGEFDHLTT